MKVLLWLTTIAHVVLRLRGDDNASGTLLLSNRGQRRMETSNSAPRQPIDDINLFVETLTVVRLESIMPENHNATDTSEKASKSSKAKGKGKSQSSKSGKGKGSSKSVKSSKNEKSSTKKSSKSNHSLKKKKHGKGRMNHVSGKGSGKGTVPTSRPPVSHHPSSKNHSSGSAPPASSPDSFPNPSPNGSPTPSSPTANQPHVIPTPPTASGPTASPSIAPTPLGETLKLSDFVLAYVFDREGVPPDSDVQAAVTVTRTYLNGFSKQRLGELKELDTRKAFSAAPEPPSPYQIGLESTAFFVSGTDPLPTVGEMDLLTTLAFSGENLRTYLDLLGQLPEANIFSTTLDVYDSILKPDDTDTVGRKSTAAIGASASAGAFIALLIGVAFYRKRSTYVDLDKLAHDGHITVAGETYIGGSTFYSASAIENKIHEAHMAGTEDCASEGGESMDFGEDTLEHQLGDLASYTHMMGYGEAEESCLYQHDPLAPVDHYSSDDESRRIKGNLSSEELVEDADVPLRVVDLIRRFSPLSR